MKKNIFSIAFIFGISILSGQEIEQDSTKTEKLDEVIVNAVRIKVDAPIAHSNLAKKEISKRNLGQDIPTLINYLPGVVTSSDAGSGIGYSSMRVRGSDGTRINVTINGIPYNDSESQGTFWVNINDFASSTESLQLQRGVGTSTNGSGAFGASLNILTNKISEKANGEISNSFGSYGTRKHTVKYSTGKLNDHFELTGRLSKIYSDGYVDRAFSDLKSYFLQGSYSDKNTIIKALIFGGKEKTYQTWGGITAEQLKENRRQNPYTYENQTDNYQQDHYQLHWSEQLTKNWTTNIGLNYTKGKGYYEEFEAGTKTDLYKNIVEGTDKVTENGKEIAITDLIRRLWLKNDFYVMNATATFHKNSLEITGGTSFNHYKGDHFGEVIWAKKFSNSGNIRDRFYFSDAKKSDYSVFAKASFNITSQLKGYVDLQGRFIDYKTAGTTSKAKNINIDSHFNFFNPKAGLTYKLDNYNSIYGSYARANREPNRNDFKNGNNKHETLNDFELGWRFNTTKTKINANLYYMGYKDQLVLSGALNDVGARLRTTSNKSYRTGVEIDANFFISKKIQIQPNFTFSKNTNVNFYTQNGKTLISYGDTPISYSPEIIAGNIISYSPVKNLQFSLLSKYIGEQFLTNTNDKNSKLKSYFINDLSSNLTIKPKKVFTSIVFTAVINNIFSEKYVSNGNDWGDGYIVYFPQATRNFLAGVTLKF